MSSLPSLQPPAAPAGWTAFFSALTGRSVVVAVVLAVMAAAALNPIFMTPFSVLLGRTLFIAMVLLLAYTAAGRWPAGGRLPPWAAQLLAVALAAPLATLAVYVLSVGGNVFVVFAQPERVSGFLWIAGSGLGLGLLLALGGLYRERVALELETLRRQAADARLALLQRQIEPHFLFNTLANVQALVESGSPRAPAVLASLIAYLKAAMPRWGEGGATLGHEVQLVRAYLELMLMRMPDRLTFSVDVPADLHTLPFPPLGLLTLVENAVRHGIDPGEAGGTIAVGAARDVDTVRVWVADSGVGMAPAAQVGTGLTNLRARLQAMYGGAAHLELSEPAPHGLRAELVLPVQP